MNEIDTLEKVIVLNKTISENILKYSMVFIMRIGITPLWEDPKNRNGGCFSFKVINKQVYDVWKILFYLLCGESIFVNKEHSKLVNGITISPKKNFCIIKIWMSSCANQNPCIITNEIKYAALSNFFAVSFETLEPFFNICSVKFS